MKNKVIFVLVFIGLICALKFLSQSKIDNKAVEEHLNSTYEDYKEDMQGYTVTYGTILKEYDADDGIEVSFYGAREWIVEVELQDGTVVEASVLRDEGEKVGDVIDIAYKNADIQYLKKYINATRLNYIECFAVIKTINILESVVKVAMFGMVGFAIFMFARKLKK